jgi:tetratricopeptide (TPR) repeat protein
VVLSTTTAFLGQALLAQGRNDEASRCAELSAEQAPEDDMHSQSMWRAVRASVLSARDEPEDAERYAREAVVFAERTDDTNTIADAHVVLGGVLARRANAEAARAELSRGIELYERKGNLVGADQVRAQLAPLARV